MFRAVSEDAALSVIAVSLHTLCELKSLTSVTGYVRFVPGSSVYDTASIRCATRHGRERDHDDTNCTLNSQTGNHPCRDRLHGAPAP
jgi:hypothetical protein